jgi:hypothetical protein
MQCTSAHKKIAQLHASHGNESLQILTGWQLAKACSFAFKNRAFYMFTAYLFLQNVCIETVLRVRLNFIENKFEVPNYKVNILNLHWICGEEKITCFCLHLEIKTGNSLN